MADRVDASEVAIESRPRRNSWLSGKISVAAAARGSLYLHTPLLVVAVCYVVGGSAFLWRLGRTPSFGYQPTYSWAVALTASYLIATLIWTIVRDVIVARRNPRSRETWHDVYGTWLGTERLVGVVLVLIAMPALLRVMYEFRLALTLIQPFYLDPTFMRVDQWVHGGLHPFEILQPIAGRPLVTDFLDVFYVAGYFLTLWVGIIWQTVSGKEPVRSQFLLTFALAWIVLGTAAAITLASGGPAFYGRITGLPDPYSPLMGYLQSVDATHGLFALANQGRLWESYTDWGGMTAMPSMHIAIVAVVGIAAVRTHPWLIAIVAPLITLMLIGSVHLGWHYAIDGYVSLVTVAILWWLTGRFLRWWSSRKARTSTTGVP